MPLPGIAGASPTVVIRILAEDLTAAVRAKISNSFGGLGKEINEAMSGQLAQSLGAAAIIAGVTAGLAKAFEAADELEQSNRTLAATATLAGVAFDDLKRVSAGVSEQFGIDNDMANRYTETVVRLTNQAGLLSKSQEAAAAFLNLGAARGYTAAQSMDALENAFVGVYRGAQRVLGQNVHEVFEKYAASVHKNVAELTEGEKAQALVNAALEKGGKVNGEYQNFLNTTAGKTEQLRIAQQQLSEAFGVGLDPLRRLALGIGKDLTDAMTDTVIGIQMLATEFGAFFFSIPARAKIAAGLVIEALAWIVDKGGDLLKLFGINVSHGLSSTLHSTATNLINEGSATLRNYQTVVEDTARELADVVAGAAAKSTFTDRNVRTPGGVSAREQRTQDAQAALRAENAAMDAAIRSGQVQVIPRVAMEEQAQQASQAITEALAGYPQRLMAELSGVNWTETLRLDPGVENSPYAAAHNAAEAVAVALQQMNSPLAETNEQIATMVNVVGYNLTHAFETAFSRGKLGAKQLGEAIKGGIMASIAGVASLKGQYFLAEAIEAFGHGLFGDPRGFAAAAKFTAAAAAMFAVAGAASAVGNSGGGGGSGGGRQQLNDQTSRVSDQRGEATILIAGGLLDMTDPRQARALQDAINELKDRRLVIQAGV